jgi:hypothetical protein
MSDKALHRSMENPMRLALAATALIAFSGSIAQAQMGSEVIARTPKKIGDFVPYCTDHFKDCRSMVVLVDIELLSEGKAHSCTIGIKDNETATKSIVGWLARREETHSMPTKTGIRTAIKVLWPC